MPLSRRMFLAQLASLGASPTASAAVPGPGQKVLGGVARAADGELSAASLRTFVAACEAACSFDGRTPPPARVNGRAPPPAAAAANRRAQPTAADAGTRFAAEYRAQSAGMRQTFDLLFGLVENAPRTPPPTGATSAQDLAAYGGRSFSELDVALRLRFIRSWASDF